jgi:hypothetical protein
MSQTQQKPLGITQKDLENFQQIEADHKELATQYNSTRKELIEKMRVGAPLQEGPLTIELSNSDRKFPDWKQAYTDRLGEAAAAELVAAADTQTIWSIDVHRRSRFARA